MAKRQRIRRKVVAPDPEVGEGTPVPEEIQEDGPEPKAEAVRPQRAPRGESVVESPVEVGAADLVQALFTQASTDGKLILVQPGKAGAFLVSLAVQPVAAATPKGKGYKEEDFWSDEYKAFKEWWTPMSAEEKEAWAVENDVTWAAHEDPLVNNIKLSIAVQAAKDVSKYKPGFESRAARITGVPTS